MGALVDLLVWIEANQERAWSLVAGFAIGLFLGGTVMWAALAWR